MYSQNYNPLGSPILSTLAAAVPIVVLLYLIALHPHRDEQRRRRSVAVTLVEAQPSPDAPAVTEMPSIVVLPFQNLSGDPEQEYFSDGIVEEITTALSRFRSLFVISRNSAFVYKGRAIDVRQVGREVRGLSVRAHHHPILVVAERRGPQPECVFGAVQMATVFK